MLYQMEVHNGNLPVAWRMQSIYIKYCGLQPPLCHGSRNPKFTTSSDEPCSFYSTLLGAEGMIYPISSLLGLILNYLFQATMYFFWHALRRMYTSYKPMCASECCWFKVKHSHPLARHLHRAGLITAIQLCFKPVLQFMALEDRWVPSLTSR